MKFRKSRIVILVVLLISVSSVGYWLMYASSSHPRRSALSHFHSYTDSENHVHTQQQHSVNSRRKGNSDKDGDYVGLFRDKARDHVMSQPKMSIYGQPGNERNKFRQMEIAADVGAGRDNKQNQISAEHQAAELKEDEKYDEKVYEDEQIDGVKDADTAAGIQQHGDDGRLNEMADDEYKDNYEDDDEHPNVEISNIRTSKSSKQVSSGKDKTQNQLPFEEKPRKDDVENEVGDDAKLLPSRKQQLRDAGVIDVESRKPMRDAGVIDDRHTSGREAKTKQRDGADEQKLTWKQDSKLIQVIFDIDSFTLLHQVNKHAILIFFLNKHTCY